jgi:hypothetical protein
MFNPPQQHQLQQGVINAIEDETLLTKNIEGSRGESYIHSLNMMLLFTRAIISFCYTYRLA